MRGKPDFALPGAVQKSRFPRSLRCRPERTCRVSGAMSSRKLAVTAALTPVLAACVFLGEREEAASTDARISLSVVRRSIAGATGNILVGEAACVPDCTKSFAAGASVLIDATGSG